MDESIGALLKGQNKTQIKFRGTPHDREIIRTVAKQRNTNIGEILLEFVRSLESSIESERALQNDV